MFLKKSFYSRPWLRGSHFPGSHIHHFRSDLVSRPQRPPEGKDPSAPRAALGRAKPCTQAGSGAAALLDRWLRCSSLCRARLSPSRLALLLLKEPFLPQGISVDHVGPSTSKRHVPDSRNYKSLWSISHDTKDGIWGRQAGTCPPAFNGPWCFTPTRRLHRCHKNWENTKWGAHFWKQKAPTKGT